MQALPPANFNLGQALSLWSIRDSLRPNGSNLGQAMQPYPIWDRHSTLARFRTGAFPNASIASVIPDLVPNLGQALAAGLLCTVRAGRCLFTSQVVVADS